MTIKKWFRFGDMIAKITKILHIPHCANCEKRRIVLNEFGGSIARGEAWSLSEIKNKLKNCCDEK